VRLLLFEKKFLTCFIVSLVLLARSFTASLPGYGLSAKEELSIDFEDMENIGFLFFFGGFGLAPLGDRPRVTSSGVLVVLRYVSEDGGGTLESDGSKTKADGGKPP
jgi:hypothetical protein